MGDDDQVDLEAVERGEVGRGGGPGELGVQAAVDDDADVAELHEVAAGADAAVPVEIEKFHFGGGERPQPERRTRVGDGPTMGGAGPAHKQHLQLPGKTHWGIGCAAGELSANADYLGRVFRVTHGATLTETLHRRRVSAARRLLCDSALRIGEIARECGFSDLSHFRDVFHRHAGMSPGQYRRLHARTHIVAD